MNLTPCVLPSCSLLPEPEAAAVARSGCWRLCLSSDRRHRSCLAGEENCDMDILVTAIQSVLWRIKCKHYIYTQNYEISKLY